VDDKADFESFFSDCHDRVVRTVTLALRDRALAEDLVQEAFARAYRRWSSVSVMARPEGWLYVVAVRGARRQLRRERSPFSGQTGLAQTTATEDYASHLALAVSLQAALDSLSPRQRAAVVLRYPGDLSLAEVARAMRCSVGTVKATLHVALAKLRVVLLEGELDDEH
jgi:RNA polymerase sigma-70 factor (ECF subfamily)